MGMIFLYLTFNLGWEFLFLFFFTLIFFLTNFDLHQKKKSQIVQINLGFLYTVDWNLMRFL